VAQLAPEAMKPDVSAHLLSLVRKELVRPDESDFADEDAFRFRHLLLRDAAYDSLPKEARAELHELFAAWLEAKVSERQSEYEEILGYHLEQAFRWRSELGESAGDLGRRAAGHLAAAGRRARQRGDMPATANLLERAASLLPPDDPARIELLPLLGSALTDSADFARAAAVLAEAISTAKAAGDPGTEALARLHHIRLSAQTDPDWVAADARRDAEAAVATFEQLGDHLGAARALQFVGLIAFWDGQCAKAEAAYEKSAEHARRAGDASQVASVPWWALAATVFGPTPVAEAESRCRELSEVARGDLYIEGFSLVLRSLLTAMGGRFDEARSLRERGRAIIEDLGMRLNLAGTSMLFGHVESLAGDNPAAEAEYRKGYDLSVEIGETAYFSSLACYLGESAYNGGRYDEALELSEEAERTGALDDVLTQVIWRTLRAKVLAQRGQFDEAEALARDAVDRARECDYLDDNAQAISTLAEVLELAGKDSEAKECFEEARQLFERKGNVVSAGRIRERLLALEAQ
jgi:predicted ATPase